MIEGAFKLDVHTLFELEKIKGGFTAAANYALERVAERLLADSRIFVPVLTGQLKDSARIEQMPSRKASVHVLRVIYDTDYAETQHEDPYNHPSLGFWGKAAYLEKPLQLFGDFYKHLYVFEFKSFIKRHGLKS